jgi:hypothetical protein
MGESFNHKAYYSMRQKAILNMKQTIKSFLKSGNGGGNIGSDGKIVDTKTIEKRFKKAFGKKKVDLNLVAINIEGYKNDSFNINDIEGIYRKAETIFKQLQDCSFYTTYKNSAHDSFLGLWVEKGRVYVDKSLLVDKRAKAEEIKEEEKQEAIYSFSNGAI